jgi:hypothetical protein
MGERQALRQQPDIAQMPDDALRIGGVGKAALINRLEEMHMHAPARPRGSFGDGAQQFVRTPLRPIGAELNLEGRALDCGGDRLDACDLFAGARHGAEELRLDDAARLGRQAREHRLGRSVDQRIAVAHEQSEGDADADIGGGARDFARLLDDRHRAMRACNGP